MLLCLKMCSELMRFVDVAKVVDVGVKVVRD